MMHLCCFVSRIFFHLKIFFYVLNNSYKDNAFVNVGKLNFPRDGKSLSLTTGGTVTQVMLHDKVVEAPGGLYSAVILHQTQF